ncbi:MAG: ATP-dependent endonuclease [Ignavibacteriae bacterium]|nr:ATP-dependent endonuclease [Ignavibacteriota bacterium]
MSFIKKLKLHNYKRFKELELELDKELNVLIGDNESGKTTILEAINLTISGKKKKIDSLYLESIFNYEVINQFLQSDRKYDNLPKLFVELYFNEQNEPNLFGQNNSEKRDFDGLRFECVPNDDLSKEVNDIISVDECIFPFEYYSINYFTFAGESYTGYRPFLKHISIDHSQIGTEYSLREYIRGMYNNTISENEKPKHYNDYRKAKKDYSDSSLSNINSRLQNYKFAIRNNSKSNLETDLTLFDDDIDIENKGKGRQCFIKTDFALSKSEDNLDLILVEEPENHLSHINVNKLIKKIANTKNTQLLISTHSNMITSRLDLRNAILLNSSSEKYTLLNSLEESTAKFFIKAPNNNLLDFVLSKKVLLVEGDAEYILLEQFFKNTFNEEISQNDIHIISVGGVSFKRYLEIAQILGLKTAVIRDNDGNYQSNCIDNYEDFISDSIKVFAPTNNDDSTFEICLFNDNTDICNELFSAGRRTLPVLDYMLKNKAEIAFELLQKKGDYLNVPSYIREALEWIKE